MKLFVLILNRIDKLDELLYAFAREEICGATIIDSTGMARELYSSNVSEEEISFLGSIRKYLAGDNDRSKTILAVIREDQQDKIIRITEEVIGDFSKPDTGILFIVPLDFANGKGLHK